MIAMLTTQLALVISATCCAWLLMIKSGLQKRMLERTARGVCPTCGRRLDRRSCDVCGRR